MTEQPARPAMTMREIRIAIGHQVEPARTAARQTTGQDDTGPASTSFEPQDHPGADLYVRLRKAGEDHDTAQALIYAHARMAVRQHTAIHGDGPAVGQPAEAHDTNSSVRNVIEHALTAYYQDSSAPSAVARAILAQHRSETLREVAETFRTEAAETATAAQENYDPDMAREAKRLNAMAARLDRMTVEGER